MTEPTQPLTEEELAAIRELWSEVLDGSTEETSFGASMVSADVHLFDLKFAKVLAEVDRLRAENTAQAQRRADLLRELAALSEAVEDAQIANESLRQERDQLRQWNASRLSPDPSSLDQSGEGQANG
jgi:hypothetical protein